MAIGIASDPRYKQGNYTGAVNQIEKNQKGIVKTSTGCCCSEKTKRRS